MGLRQGRLYAGHGAGALFPVEEHVALLAISEKLYQSILAGSENRIEERTHFEDREVDIVLGIDKVMRKVREAPSTATTPQQSGGGDALGTIELSPSGCRSSSSVACRRRYRSCRSRHRALASPGPELESYGCSWTAPRRARLLNGIIALRTHESGGWILVTVCASSQPPARRDLAASRCSHYPRSHRAHLELIGGLQALYLPGTDANGKLDSILVRAGDFHSDQNLSVGVGSARYRVRLNRIIRKGADWIKARFEIESKT